VNGRRIFIGDIQGCRAELEALLAEVAFDPAHDRLHPVGDLVNRGPDSLGVLRLLRKLDAQPVLGNHDVHLLRRAHGLRQSGSRDTLDAVLTAPDRGELLEWLGAQPFLRAFDDVLMVHAALNPAWEAPEKALAQHDPLQVHPNTDFATRVRYCDAGGNRPATDWPPPPAPFVPWFEHWQAREDERTVVFGHWARMGKVERPRVRGLDTGCVWGKELTAWIAEDDRFVSVPAARIYSPTSLPPEAFDNEPQG